MNTTNDYSPYLEHLTLEEIVKRDVDGRADEQEGAYLRSEENLSDLRAALGSLNTALDNELAVLKDRVAVRERLYGRVPDNAGVREVYEREQERYEDRKQQIKSLKEIVGQRLEENKALRQRPLHRDLLIQARRFLAEDRAIAYSYIPERDDLLAKIDRSLYGDDCEEANE